MQVLKIFQSSQKSAVKNPYHTLYHTLVLSISIVYLSYFYVYLSAVDFSIVVSIYSIDFNPVLAESILQSIPGLGGLFGAFSPAFFLPLVSRRQSLLLINCFSALLCLASVYPNYKCFIVIRFLQGVVGGMMNTLVPMIIKESTPIEMATLTGALTNLSFFFGFFVTYTFGYVLNVISGDMTGSKTWQILFLSPLILIGVQTFLLWKVFPYETPKYLAQKQSNTQLKLLLQKMYKSEYVERQLQQTLKQYGSQSKNQSQTKVNGHYCSPIALIVGITYAFVAPMSGVSACIIYCKQQLANIFPTLEPILGSLTMLVYFLFSMASLGYSQRYGRKNMTLWGARSLFVANYCIAVGFLLNSSYQTFSQILILFSFVFFLLVVTMTFGPILWMWTAEALQPSQIGYAIMMNWLGAALNGMLYPILKNWLPNEGFIYMFYGSVALLFVPVVKNLMIETKGKTGLEIAVEYKALDDKLWLFRKEKKELEIEMITW